MAANPSTLSDSRTMRAGTGIGIALAIAATVGVLAYLAPKLREEMREDIFSGDRMPAVAAKPAAVASPAPAPAAARPGAEVAGPPLALKPARDFVPPGSLGPGESELAPSKPVAHRAVAHRNPARAKHRPEALARKKSNVLQAARADLPAPEAPARGRTRASASSPPAYRERVQPYREWRSRPREDPFDYRTWRQHRNPDALPTTPVERQPG